MTSSLALDDDAIQESLEASSAYPDTGESGEVYDLELGIDLRKF